MNHNASERLSAKDLEKVEKYIRPFIEKVPQIIVQSRCGERKHVIVKPSTVEIFELAIENNADILKKTVQACESIIPVKPFSLCVEILLKTADGDILVLEAWQIQLEPSEKYWQLNHRMFQDCETVRGHLLILMKSITAVTRIIPAFKMSLCQSADTYVMLYRIYSGDPQVDHLGTCPQHNKIGEACTPVGVIRASVTYRSKLEMTIAPQRAGKENFMVKSDYFDVDMSPTNQPTGGIQLKKMKSPCQNSSSYQNVGAFAPSSNLPDAVFPELAFLEKPFLNLSRGAFQRNERKSVDNINNTDTNLNIIDVPKVKTDDCLEKDFEKLCSGVSCTDLSDGSDFVLIDVKPPFARCDSGDDLGAFYEECQSAPPLPSLSGQVTLKDQVCDITNQLARFETSMSDYDSFVDSVCQVDK